MKEITLIQNEVIKKLEKRGFRWSGEFENRGSEGVTVALRKTKNRISHLYAEVDFDGSVNGQTLAEFLKS